MSSRVIVALDVTDVHVVEDFVREVPHDQCRLKVGKQLFTREGPALVRDLVADGYDVFLDLKYHDIPNTVARACESAMELGIWMVNIHALGGEKMMRAAREVISGDDAPILIAVTWLTSSGQSELDALGIDTTPDAFVERMAKMAHEAGLDGVVSSAQEAGKIKGLTSPDFVTVTPGIRPAGVSTDDQTRIMTPVEAVENGSDYLVIGRPITQADDPCKVLRTINGELDSL